MSDDIMRACMKDIHEIFRLKQLNVEILENLELIMLWLKDYHEKTKAPIPNIEKLKSLLTKTDHLIDEICSQTPFLQDQKQTLEASDDFLHDHESDEDLTESCLARASTNSSSIMPLQTLCLCLMAVF